MPEKRQNVYIASDPELRWRLKLAAVAERCTMQKLIARILEDWLNTHGGK